MTLLEQLFNSKRIFLADGAMGTELQKRGMEDGACPELLNLTNPELIRGIHRDYLKAGADIIETNTFGANRARLRFHDAEEKVSEIIVAAVNNAKNLEGDYLIAGSMGPTGDLIEPLGTLSIADTYSVFKEQAIAMYNAGVDLVFIETMMAPEEVTIAIQAVKENTPLPVVAMMTFERGLSGNKTMWGTDVAQAAALLEEAGADIIGSNCGRGFDEMEGVINEFSLCTQKPLIAMANAGIPVWEDGRSVYKETPEVVAVMVERILKAGVKIIGGCCGTSPAHIKEIRKLLNLIPTNIL